jgi:ATP-binding cassette subfamily F protein uup
VVFGYYRQDGPGFRADQRMIEYIQERSEAIQMATGEVLSSAQFLEFFQFPRSQHYTPIGKLSGGEKRRLYLVTLLLANPNFLILDEPTNDLDLQTLQALEEFLDQYQGVLVVVSHDRFLLDRVTDHLFIFEGNGIVRDYNGRYADYWLEREMDLQKRALEAEAAPQAPKAEEPKRERQREKRGLSNFEQREFERLEKEIAELEHKRAELAERMSHPDTDYTQIQTLAQTVEELTAQIDAKTERWLTLAEYV